ncbi:MAG TPA: SGNH/GDSL hydrolase family protein [Streptosporangiaceae bacterium]|nr:SGNH/GDSL hydrolase family protein [Streptosporangiaceae bacterium]
MVIGSFAALGDSLTEGMNDPRPEVEGGGYRGWADRFAERLTAANPELRYANLAVRGKLLKEVVAEQLPIALATAPDLVSLAAGGNDLIRPGADPDTLGDLYAGAVTALRQSGSQVLVVTGFDPRTFPVLRWIRGKVAIYNMHLRSIADRYGCPVLDLWSMPVLCDPRVWSDDRLHLTPEGHRRVALRACEAVGAVADADWREPLPVLAGAVTPAASIGWLAARQAWLTARQVDARWARRYAMPWVRRRLQGASTGDGLAPKRPELLPLNATAPAA